MVTQYLIILCLVALLCILFQRLLRQRLSRDQYFYIRDISLSAAMTLLALWSGDRTIRLLVATAILSLYAGLLDQVMPEHKWKWLLPLPGLLFALSVHRLSFLYLPGGYMYLSLFSGVALTVLWLTIFPLLFQKLDSIPGLAGHLLGASLCLMTFVTGLSGVRYDAFFICLGALTLAGAYWSRIGHHYQQLGTGLCNLWGTLIAGISLLGVGKVATLTSLFLVPLAFYALPLIEMSLGLVNNSFSSRGTSSPTYIYSRVLERGVDHPAAIRLVTVLCFVFGLLTALFRMAPRVKGLYALAIALVAVTLAIGWVAIRRAKPVSRDSSLWGVPLDGISMNYALSKTLSWIKANGSKPLRQVVTLNALGMNDARKNKKFAALLRQTDLNLPDGAGLVWAMKLLHLKAVERVSGCDYMARLCRLAAVEGFSIYLFGGKPGVAERAAKELQKENPGLSVAGIEHGYISEAEKDVLPEKIQASGASVLFVALGMPSQEFWIAKHRDELSGLVAVGVGGSFDVFSGDLKRAPAGWSKIGMEWLYRTIQEPKRIKRNVGLFVFVLQVFKTKLFGGKI